MKKVAVCGAAVPSTLKMVAGAAANCWIWFRNEPAMNDAKNTVSTCASQRSTVSSGAAHTLPGA